MTFIRGGHYCAFWMNFSQAAALLAASESSPAIGMAETYSNLPKIFLRAFLWMDSNRSSKKVGRAANTGEAYSITWP